jgi:hypothetical protein
VIQRLDRAPLLPLAELALDQLPMPLLLRAVSRRLRTLVATAATLATSRATVFTAVTRMAWAVMPVPASTETALTAHTTRALAVAATMAVTNNSNSAAAGEATITRKILPT